MPGEEPLCVMLAFLAAIVMSIFGAKLSTPTEHWRIASPAMVS